MLDKASELQECSLATNSSAETPACFKIPASVPAFSSLWFGTTHPEAPYKTGSLGMNADFKSG